MSKKYGNRVPPGLGYFRKGNYVKYDGKQFLIHCLFQTFSSATEAENRDISNISNIMLNLFLIPNIFLTLC